MFGNCCGRKKSKKKETKDAETQSEYELFDEKPDVKHGDDDKRICDNNIDDVDQGKQEKGVDLIVSGGAIVDQPHSDSLKDKNDSLNEVNEVKDVKDTKNDKTTNDNVKPNLEATKILQKQSKFEHSLELPEESTSLTTKSSIDKSSSLDKSGKSLDKTSIDKSSSLDNSIDKLPSGKTSFEDKSSLSSNIIRDSVMKSSFSKEDSTVSEVTVIANVPKLSTSSQLSQTDIQIQINGLDVKPHEDLGDDDVDLVLSDDEVFEEGVGPPIKLAKNMGKPLQKGQVHVALPKWFSEESEADERDGTQEPPATPIGKDELALRRHRFFSELLNAAQNANEHKVHFDPLGPTVSSVDLPHSQELEQLVSRLENVTSRLENVCQPVQEILKLSSCASLQDFLDTPLETPLPPPAPDIDLVEDSPVSIEEQTVVTIKPSNQSKVETKTIAMSVYGYQDVMQGPLAQFLAVSQQLGGDIASHAAMVKNAFDTQLQYIIMASECKQPAQSEINNLIQPTAKCIQQIQEFREKNRGSPFFNHLSAISESIPALGWVAVSPTPGPYVKEMNDAGQFYTNRVLKDWKEKDKKHVDWVKSWVQTLTELQAFVKQYHTTGLVWSGKGAAGGVSGVPPPPGPPPPPAMCDLSDMSIDPSNDRSALFDQINQGADITKSLKKVTSDMQTHKNPTLRTGPAPFKAPGSMSTAVGAPRAPVDKPPVFNRDGKKWMIEYQKGNNNLVVDGAEMNNVVYLFKCTDSTVTVKGKINSITLDSCKKTSVVFDSLVSCVEFINCQSVQMQVLNKVPTISIDKTDGCQMYLSNESLDVEIISSKSSEMNVLVPKPNGEYVEHPIPEQYKTKVVPGGLNTVIVESKG